MRGLFFLLVLSTLSARADVSFGQMARDIYESTWTKLINCGLRRMDAYDPYLPRPMVPAREAVVNSRYQVLAYADEEFFTGRTITFKNPNGSYRHDIVNGVNLISVYTYLGKVADAWRYNTIDGPQITYKCGNHPSPVSPEQWASCVERDYSDFIARQLCRFP